MVKFFFTILKFFLKKNLIEFKSDVR